MGDLETWLNDEAKLNVKVFSYEKEFANGFYFGKILFNFGLMPEFLDYFHNKPQPVYRNTHYQLLELVLLELNINLDSDLLKSLIKEELGIAKKLLYKIKGELTRMKDKAENPNKTGYTLAELSLHNKVKNLAMPQKSENIEMNLVRFEEEFLRQKEKARIRKEADDKRYQELVQTKRNERRTNYKTNYDYMRDWEKRLHSLWKHSRISYKELKDKTVKFNASMTQKIKDGENQRMNANATDFFGGITSFEENANRLGVELYPDGDKIEEVKEKAPVNSVAMLQKIKSRSNANEEATKQKESRARMLKVKQEKLKIEVNKKIELNEKINKYSEKMAGSN